MQQEQQQSDLAAQYANVILSDVEQAKNYLAAYNNLILSFQTAYVGLEGIELAKALTQDDKVKLANTVALFRSYCTRAYINLKSVEDKINTINPETGKIIDESYNSIQTTAMPNFDTAFQFVLSINKILIENINMDYIFNKKKNLETASSVLR